jgi:hypothetical protein
MKALAWNNADGTSWLLGKFQLRDVIHAAFESKKEAAGLGGWWQARVFIAVAGSAFVPITSGVDTLRPPSQQ